MNPKRGGVFKVLEPDGRVANPGHPFVILYVSNEIVLFSNITDVEKEDDVTCLLHPEDAPNILTKASTFRYQNICEAQIADMVRAFAHRKLLHCGEIPNAAFQKILAGAATARLIKPKYRPLLSAEQNRRH